MAERDTRPNSKVFTLQGGGGAPPQVQVFTVKEHQVTNQPQTSGTWDPKDADPLGPK